MLGSLAIAWWHGSLTWRDVLGSLMGATRAHLHDHVHPGRRLLPVDRRWPSPASRARSPSGSTACDLSPYALIAVLTVMYIVLGTALDGISMIVLTTAVVLPMIQKAGFDLVWFGIFIVLLVEMAEVTPPVGFNLFVLQTMSGKDTNTVARAVAAVLLPACRGGRHHHGISRRS